MKYNETLKDIPGAELFEVPENTVHSYYKYPVFYSFRKDRDELVKKLKADYGIETSRVYVPCHLQPFYKEKFGYSRGLLPVTEKTLDNVICLPMHPQLSEDEQEYVVESFKKEIGQW